MMRLKLILPTFLFGTVAMQAEETKTLEQVRVEGALQSVYLKPTTTAPSDAAQGADLKGFHAEIEPLLKETCLKCHGPDRERGGFRIDTLDPDLINGVDSLSWLDAMEVLANGEMPPEDGPELSDEDRNKIVTWLSSEIQVASQVKRNNKKHSSFRRMTRYEYNYALQDLLGLPFDFAGDLPPEPVSEDGFSNSSEMLQISERQYAEYLKLNRKALNRATVRGEKPKMLHWGITPEFMATRRVRTRQQLDEKLKKENKKEAAEIAIAERTPSGPTNEVKPTVEKKT